jgi:hypothetical protein
MPVGFPAKTTYANGDVFSASDINDTNGTINLLTSTQFAAGKNKIINGDFRFNQRVFTSNTTSLTYNFDRWLQSNSGGTFTLTPQTFTPGAAPVAGYEGSTYLRGITASQSGVGDYALFEQKIEDVRTLAGSTATVSFYAKAATGTPKIGVEVSQNFGTGGSPSATVNTPAGSVTLTTSWVRYSVSVAVPSISGKTIGTSVNSSFLETNLWVSSGSTNATRASSIGIQNNTFDVWGVQVEQSATASSFQTATGTIQGELAACQRYYFRVNGNGNYQPIGFGYSDSTTVARMYVTTPPMRILPATLDYTNLSIVADAIYNSTATVIGASSPNMVRLDLTGLSGLTAFRSYALLLQNSANQFVGLSAEL